MVTLTQTWWLVSGNITKMLRWQDEGLNPGLVKEERLIGWSHPSGNRVKLNIDGCSKGNLGPLGAGGLIRDRNGDWRGGL